MTLSAPKHKFENFRFCAFSMVSSIKDRFIFSSANTLHIVKRKILYIHFYYFIQLMIERKSNLESRQELWITRSDRSACEDRAYVWWLLPVYSTRKTNPFSMFSAHLYQAEKNTKMNFILIVYVAMQYKGLRSWKIRLKSENSVLVVNTSCRLDMIFRPTSVWLLSTIKVRLILA